MKKILIIGMILVSISIAFLSWNNVDTSLTNEDVIYVQKFMKSNMLDTFSRTTYQDEIRLIKLVQQNVLNRAPKNKGIPHNMSREPKDIYTYEYGLCYDRSRVIEKVLKTLGFETRHIAAYKARKGSKNFMPDYLNSNSESHAFSEVKTSKGWMFIDSNDLFLGLNSELNPVSIQNVENIGFHSISWSRYNNLEYKPVYKKDGFTFLYGLYSRHGYFYPPYNFFPDINWNEFSYNF